MTDSLADPTTILHRFAELEQRNRDKVYLHQPHEGRWLQMTWSEVGAAARRLAQALTEQGYPPGSNIAILSKNCAHWIVADLGIWMAGHVSVPLYPTLTAESIQTILEHSEARLLIAGKLDAWSAQRRGVPAGIAALSFPLWHNDGTERWEDFVDTRRELAARREPRADEVATIIYTSGTTGTPKGVVHDFGALGTHVVEAMRCFPIDATDRFSYLPLSHVAERILVECGSLYCGGEVYFAESLDAFKANLAHARPTVFLAVPRIWLKFQQGVLQTLPQRRLDTLLSLPIVRGLVAGRIRRALGLGEVRFAFTGAAPISKELLLWFERLGLPIYECFGMTENFGISNLNVPGARKSGTVGKVFPDTELRISEAGEILTRSRANMVGYFKEPALTAEMIDADGWIHTGDKGELDSEGFLRITGRVKDLFKTSKGKYVAPSPIEGHLLTSTMVDQVCVMGSGLPQPLAIVVLAEAGRQAARGAVEAELAALLERVNARLESHEHLSAIVVVQDEWTVENGILTPSLKLKRNVVEVRYAPGLEAWSVASAGVIFHRADGAAS